MTAAKKSEAKAAKKAAKVTKRAEHREATEATKAARQETFAERQARETVEAGNVIQGQTEPRERNLKTEEVEDEQERINREVEEAQAGQGSTASKTPGPKAK